MVLKERYINFAEAAPDFPVFHQAWYLDAVAGAAGWDYVAAERGGQLVGVWPFVLKKKWSKTWVVTPPLLRYLGPYILPDFRTVRHENHLFTEMLEQMPSLAAFDQDFQPDLKNGLALHWKGFSLRQRYTYVISDLTDMDALWKKIGSDYRKNKIPRADSFVEVVESTDARMCYDLQAMSYERQEMEAPFSWEYFQKLDAALTTANQRTILLAKDRETGTIHAACYLVFDKKTAYYLLAGDNPDLRSSGASILLAWESIRLAAENLKVERFDFLGSMSKNIERVRRNFGAEQCSYLRVERDWDWVFRVRRGLR